jgi:single-strand DNA-binding protein
MSLNKVFVLGNVGRIDKRLNSSQNLTVSFSLAVNERYNGKDGNVVEHTEWINCVAFGGTAKLLEQVAFKGTTIGVEGALQTRSYEDKRGEKAYATSVKVIRLTYFPSKKERLDTQNTSQGEFPTQDFSFDESEEIPF